ncbi:MAG: hypothetical protein QUU85_07725 [Candidatus Eisenbacteria bacterium]|nr:hypothetical protein [Candidatus Eisenbacteria bacterium]
MKHGRMIGILLLGLALVGIASEANAESRIGVGYFRPEAPIGVRIWAAPKIGIDLGIGFQTEDVPDPTQQDPNNTSTKVGFTFDGGVPIVLVGDATSTAFFVRPGIAFSSEPVSADDNATDIVVSGHLGVEHHFAKWFSLEVAHGIYFSSHDPGTPGSDSTTQFASEAFGISSLGFHAYIFGD